MNINNPYSVRLLLAIVLTCAIGCGSKPLDETVAADSAAAYQQAMEAYDAEEYAASSDLLDAALADAGLPPDIYVDALIKRAICRARTERYDEALTDLQEAEQGPINLAVVHATRSYVFRKQGKKAESRSELAAAKKIDRRIRALKD